MTTEQRKANIKKANEQRKGVYKMYFDIQLDSLRKIKKAKGLD